MRRYAFLPLPAFLVLLAGCSANFDGNDAPAGSSMGRIMGNVQGGRQAVSGARVFVLAASQANTNTYGGPGIAASASNLSSTLLVSSSASGYTTTKDTDSSSATFGDWYVTTDAGGNFGISGEYTCTQNTQVYLYVVGGQPAPSVTNASAAFLAVLGNCPVTGTMSAQVPFVAINEVSTLAAAYALAGFGSDALHISTSGTTLGNQGLKNAAANAALLYDISGASGATARLTTPGGNGTVPQARMNSLANVLAACVNSAGATSAQCTTNLFNTVKSQGASGVTATDTATEAIYLAQNPGTAVSALFGNTTGIGTPFQPSLTVAPNDWTVPVSFTGFSGSYLLAVDGSGNVWSPNSGNSTVSVVKPDGTPVAGFPLAMPSANPTGAAIDLNGVGWFASYGGSNLSAISPSGTRLYGSPLALPNSVIGLAIDGNSTIYIPTGFSNNVASYSSTGTMLFGSGFGGNNAAGEFLNNVYIAAVDSNGALWFASQGGMLAISKFSSSGAGLQYTSAPAPPNFLSIDHSNRVWVAMQNGQFQILNNAGTQVSFSPVVTPFNDLLGLSIDGAGNVFGAAPNSNCVVEVSGTGTVLSPSTGYNGLSTPSSVVVDGSGNVWAANTGSTTLTEYVGLAVPVATPLAYGVKNNLLGARP